MRDPFSWSFPLGRVFGITVRVHLLFPLFALAMILRVAFDKDFKGTGLWVDTTIVLALLFFSVLLHEFGHCFAARSVEGDAQEVLLWPLGGLAAVEVPHTPKANFITAAGGPAVNLVLCLGVGLILAANSFVPAFNPLDWSNAYAPKLYNWADDTNYGSKHFLEKREGDLRFLGYVEPGPAGTPNPVDPTLAERNPGKYETVTLRANQVSTVSKEKQPPEYVWKDTQVRVVPAGRAELTSWQVLAARFFWVNWALLLLNVLLPGFPLDGGRMLQSIVWWRTDYRQGTITAVFAGFVVMIVIALFGIVVNEVMPLLLAAFIYVSCRHQWYVLETGGEEHPFGYDFSQGYTSLERDQPAQPRRKRPNFIQRWLQKRAQKKAQREQETREAEERRMDELLEKVQQHGLQALTDEERRFLTRVSARYRNRH
jgi:Zn-dependent protease